MNLLEAVEKAEHNENVRNLKGYFLGSSFASLSFGKREVAEWTLLFYNPSTKTVVDCLVNDKFITLGEQTPALKEIDEIRITDVETDVDNVIDELKKQFKKESISTLISLHKKDFESKKKLVWTVAFITQEMSATSFDVDAKTGKLLKEETTSLIKRL